MISVIIPNYNHAAYLRQRIESVLKQSYRDIEVIILDDCSTDDSRVIIESFRSHPSVSHIVYNELNSGSTFLQWEKGIQLAKGDWIWIAESDDYADLDLLKQLTANIPADRNVALSYCQSYEVDENNQVMGTQEHWTNDVDPLHWLKDYRNKGTDEIAKYLSFKNTIPNASAVIFKKSAYLAVPKTHMQMKYCGDWMLWIQMLLSGDISFVATPLNYFRKHQFTTRTMSSPQKLRNRLEEEYEMLLYLKQEVGLAGSEYKRRVKWILNLYKHSFNRKQLINSLVPFLYNGRIPYRLFVGHVAKEFLRKQRREDTKKGSAG